MTILNKPMTKKEKDLFYDSTRVFHFDTRYPLKYKVVDWIFKHIGIKQKTL